MSKESKFSRFATVSVQDGDKPFGNVWQYSIPDYIGRLHVGDLVVVGDSREDEYRLGKVLSIDSRAAHRPCNIRPIVDKVKVSRWLRSLRIADAKAQLMHDMEHRQMEIDALEQYSASAEKDAAMKKLLRRYKKLA